MRGQHYAVYYTRPNGQTWVSLYDKEDEMMAAREHFANSEGCTTRTITVTEDEFYGPLSDLHPYCPYCGQHNFRGHGCRKHDLDLLPPVDES